MIPRSSLARVLLFAVLAMLLAAGARAQPGNRAPTPPEAAPVSAAAGVQDPREALPSRPVSGIVFSEIQLRDLPRADSIWSLIETADALTIVDRIENGGLYLGEQKLMGNVGSSWTQTGFTMDGLDLTDPDRTGTLMGYLDPRALQSLQVVSSLPAADLAGAGPTVVLTPRAPARVWGGSLAASYLPNPLQARDDASAFPSIAKFGSAGEGSLNLSGPFARGGGLFVTARRAQSRRFERTVPTPLDARLSSVFVHASVEAAPGERVRLVASTDATSHPFLGRLRFPDRGVTAADSHWHLHGIWEHAALGGGTWSLAAAFERGAMGAPEGGDSPTIGVIERLTDGPVSDTVASWSGAVQRFNTVVRARPVAGGVGRGRHTLDLGASLGLERSSTDPLPAAVVGETVDGVPARAWWYTGGGASLRRATELAAWVGDRIALSPRVSIDGGVRYEVTRATARDNPTAINWQTVLPRGSLRVNLTGGGAVSFQTGYGLYRHRLPLGYLAYGDASAPSARVYRWTDPNGDRRLQLTELGLPFGFSGPGSRPGYETSIDPTLQAPLTDEVMVGFEARFGAKWRGRLTGFERHQRRLIAPVNVGVTAADYTARQILDRGNDFFNPIDDRYLTVYDRKPSSFLKDSDVLTNPEGHTGNQVALDLELERLFDGRWYMLFGASAQRSDGYAGNPGFHANENDTGVLGALFEDPNALTYARGRLFFERGYIIKWSGGFQTAHDFHFGAIARYQDGQHFARMAIVPDLNQGPTAVQAYTRGHSRFTFTFTLDARAEKAFGVGRRRVALVAEAFNLLNNRIEVEEDPVVTRSFRLTTAIQPPRAVRLGLRLDF